MSPSIDTFGLMIIPFAISGNGSHMTKRMIKYIIKLSWTIQNNYSCTQVGLHSRFHWIDKYDLHHPLSKDNHYRIETWLVYCQHKDPLMESNFHWEHLQVTPGTQLFNKWYYEMNMAIPWIKSYMLDMSNRMVPKWCNACLNRRMLHTKYFSLQTPNLDNDCKTYLET